MSEETRQRALALAYAFLNRRERTIAELRARLERDELSASDVDAALERLCADGYLDDRRYARIFTQDRRTLDGWGAERIRRTLRERGIEREITEEALREGEDTDPGGSINRTPELRRALDLLHRRFPEPPRERRERDRALGVMLRKGYSTELALDALAAYGAPAEDQ